MGRSSTWEQTTATFLILPSALLPAAYPAAVQAHQHWLLDLRCSWSLLSGSGACLLGLLLLLRRSLLAMLIGEQTDLFGTDLGSSEPLEQAARHAIRPGTPGQHGCFLQGLADRSSFQVDEQLIGRTPATPASLAAKASARHQDASERRGYAPAHGSLQSALLFPTVRTGRPLIFPLFDGLLQRLAHGKLPSFLDLLFHFG